MTPGRYLRSGPPLDLLAAVVSAVSGRLMTCSFAIRVREASATPDSHLTPY